MRSETPTAASEPRSSGSSPASDLATPVVEIVSGLQWDSVVYQMEIRNAGENAVNVRLCRLVTAGTKGLPIERLTLVRGSFELCPGERALIVTHPAIDPNDEFRSEFENLYIWIKSGDKALTLSAGGFTLVDDKGLGLGDPSPTKFTVVGKCCTNPSGTCICFGGVCSGGCSGACWANIGQARCCNVTALNACCFKAGDTTNCLPINGCPSGASACP